MDIRQRCDWLHGARHTLIKNAIRTQVTQNGDQYANLQLQKIKISLKKNILTKKSKKLHSLWFFFFCFPFIWFIDCGWLFRCRCAHAPLFFLLLPVFFLKMLRLQSLTFLGCDIFSDTALPWLPPSILTHPHNCWNQFEFVLQWKTGNAGGASSDDVIQLWI